MKRAVVVLLVACLALPLLAGCAAPKEQSPDALVRTVRVDIDPATLSGVDGPDALMRLAKTTFTYTQLAGSLDVVGATVAYTDVLGNAVQKPLADFTGKQMLATGDAVTIEGAAFTSSLAIAKGGVPVASREGRSASWLQAAGAPLPLAASSGGLAGYHLSSTGALGLSLDKFSTDGSDPMTVSDAKLDSSAKLEGTLALGATSQGGVLNVSLAASLTATSSLSASGTVQAGNHSGPASAAYQGDAQVAGTFALQFAGGTLQQAGAGGSAHADATVQVRQPGEAEATEMPGMQHPLLDESQPFTWTPAPTDAAPAEMRTFLQNLYGLSLLPGDRFTVHVATTQGGVGGEFVYDLSAAALQDRTVAGHAFSALKLIGQYSAAVRVDGKGDTAKAMAFTYWVDAATLLPLEMSWEAAQTFSNRDFEAVWSVLRMFNPDTALPENLHLTASATGSILLDRFAPGFQLPAAAVVGGGTGLWVPLAAAAFVLTSNLGKSSQDGAPSIMLVQDSTVHTLTVVSADYGIPYSELALHANGDARVAFNAPATSRSATLADGPVDLGSIATHPEVEAGDVLSLCGTSTDGTVSVVLIHTASNTLLY
ncbi:MAG: hypothetical protein QOI63_2047, partial [Thermoplasmata archaeon]|nr:hypothetical protein [Thermoplasmata archaeon]